MEPILLRADRAGERADQLLARLGPGAARPCGMTAVLGLDREKLQEACRQAAGAGVVEIANHNCPGL